MALCRLIQLAMKHTWKWLWILGSLLQCLKINQIHFFQTRDYPKHAEYYVAKIEWLPLHPMLFSYKQYDFNPWKRHQSDAFPLLLVICAGNLPITGEFLALRPVTRRYYVFFDLRLNKRLSKPSWGWLFETPSHQLWCHYNEHSGLHVQYQAMVLKNWIYRHLLDWDTRLRQATILISHTIPNKWTYIAK